MKLNTYLARSTVVAALGGLLFGFDTAVISGTTAALTEIYHLTPERLGVTVASAIWGTIVGAMLAGYPGERFGRRDSLRIMAVLYLVSALGCALAWDWHSLLVFRFIGGLGVGGVVGSGTYVYRGDSSSEMARQAGGIVPVQCCIRNPARILLELLRDSRAPWKCGVALGIRRRCSTRSTIPRIAVCHPAESPLAGQERQDCRGQDSSGIDRG